MAMLVELGSSESALTPFWVGAVTKGENAGPFSRPSGEGLPKKLSSPGETGTQTGRAGCWYKPSVVLRMGAGEARTPGGLGHVVIRELGLRDVSQAVPCVAGGLVSV